MTENNQIKFDQMLYAGRDYSSISIFKENNYFHELKNSDANESWKIFSKAKNVLKDGIRLENYTWRLFYLQVFLC
jgi:hypothetical protein